MRHLLYSTTFLQLVLGQVLAVSNLTFPSDFLFGVATASYQIEGGWDADGKGANIWDTYSHVPGNIKDASTGDVACDSYHKYLEDVDLLAELGVYHYRISLSWSRILPKGTADQINQAGVDYYKKLFAALKAKNITPMVTLFHWDLPQALQDLGGFTNDSLAGVFGDYARVAFESFGDDVKWWFTFNEAKQTCLGGYGDGDKAPGYKDSGVSDYKCVYVVLKAHAKAYHIYDEEFREKQNGNISIVIDTTFYEPASDKPEDIEAAERTFQFSMGLYANAIFGPKGDYPEIVKQRVGNRSKLEGYAKSRLPEFTPEEINYIKGTADFFSLNTYTTNYAEARDEDPISTPNYYSDLCTRTFVDPSWETTASDWLYVVPWGIRKLLNAVDQHYGHPKIIITENGVSDRGELDDQKRINYYREHLSQVLLAIYEDDIEVFGYTAWSLLDNFEWSMGYTEKFGLYNVDFDSPNRTRTAKASSKYYKKIIETKCLVDVCEDN